MKGEKHVDVLLVTFLTIFFFHFFSFIPPDLPASAEAR